MYNDRLECVGPYCHANSLSCITRSECSRTGGNIFSQKCVYCLPGETYQSVSGTCRPRCSGNSVFNQFSNRCECRAGFTQIGASCVLIPSCQFGQVLRNNVCVCPDGWTWLNNRCQQIPTCKTYENLVNNECVCIDGYGRNDIDKNCIEIPFCSPSRNLVLDRRTFECVCRNGYVKVANLCVEISRCGQN